MDAGRPLREMGAPCANDAECSSGYCNAVCTTKQPNGGTCAADRDCASAHCEQNVCCTHGDCCTIAEGCPASYSSPATCDDPHVCQGTRKEAVCAAWQCSSRMTPDDSACTASVVASDCGPLRDQRCTGDAAQPYPQCPSRCDSTNRCEIAFYCDRDGVCRPRKQDGETCPAEDPNGGFQCIGEFCQSNGLCCSGGADCCHTAADCIEPRYSTWNCRVTLCKGWRADAVCNAGRCERGPIYDAPDECASEKIFCPKEAVYHMCPFTCDCDSDADCVAPAAVCRNRQCVDSGLVPLY